MDHKSFDPMQCPIARSVDRVGAWRSVLILRDATQGVTRFDRFQNSLGIGSNTPPPESAEGASRSAS